MKWKKAMKIAVPILAVVLIISLFTMSASAAIQVGSTNVANYFQYHNSSGWHDLKTPWHYIVGTNEVAYCVEHKKSSPHGTSYSQTDILDSYSARTQTGLRIILENGYPYTTGGLSVAEARYATANAIRYWLSEQGESQFYNFTNYGAYSDAQMRAYAASGNLAGKIRAKSGYTDVLQFSVELLIKARSQRLMMHDVSFSPMSMRVSGGYFIGTTRVTLANMNKGYTLNTGGLPAGSSVSGYRGANGDVLTIRIPMSAANSNRGFSISATGYDNRMRANMAVHDASSSRVQAVVTVITGTSTVADTASLSVRTPAVPDLIVLSISTKKSSYEAGETIRVTVKICNQGTGTAGAFKVSLASNTFSTQTKNTSALGAGASRTITFTYTAPTYTANTRVTFTATADSTNAIMELNESNNSRSTSTTVKAGLPDLSIISLYSDKSSYEAGETVSVTVKVKNSGYTAVSSSVLKLQISGVSTKSRTVPSLAGNGGVRTIRFTFTAPMKLTDQTITLKATIDPSNAVKESNERNNTRSASLVVKALRPDITIIGSTATDWYAGKEVVVSATVRNLTEQPVSSLKVRLCMGSVSMTETIPIAGNGSNLAVFRYTVPRNGGYTVSFTADADNAVGEIDESNNTWSKDVSVFKVPASIVLDPDDAGMEQRFDAYGLLDMPSMSSSAYHCWQEVRLEDGRYVTKSYWARLTTTFRISPDSQIAYSDKPDVMESGFGVQAVCQTTLTTNYDHPEKLVGAQMVWVRYPESTYGQTAKWQNVRDGLVVKSGEAVEKVIAWQYAVNAFSATGRQLHYTPLWFPDGAYTAWAQAFYAWSPVGQLYDNKTDDVTISGDMYDRITTIRR